MWVDFENEIFRPIFTSEHPRNDATGNTSSSFGYRNTLTVFFCFLPMSFPLFGLVYSFIFVRFIPFFKLFVLLIRFLFAHLLFLFSYLGSIYFGHENLFYHFLLGGCCSDFYSFTKPKVDY